MAEDKGEVALITGGASGIGFAVAEHLINHGWTVAIVDFNAEGGQKAADSLGPKASFLRADVSDYDQLATAFNSIWTKCSRLDFVFANAASITPVLRGYSERTDFFGPASSGPNGVPVKLDTSVINVCLNGVLYSAYLALHYFRKNKGGAGKLVSTSSQAGLYTLMALPLYSTAKHGVIGITRALGERLITTGEPITVNCICPGFVPTPAAKRLGDLVGEEDQTPISTITRATDGFLNDLSKNRSVAECSGTNIHYRTKPEWADNTAKHSMGVIDPFLMNSMKNNAPSASP